MKYDISCIYTIFKMYLQREVVVEEVIDVKSN